MDIIYLGKDQNWADETTIYWFSVDCENYGIAYNNGKTKLLDCDGCPVEECNARHRFKDYILKTIEDGECGVLIMA